MVQRSVGMLMAAPGPLHIVPVQAGHGGLGIATERIEQGDRIMVAQLVDAICDLHHELMITKQLDTRQAWDNFYDDPLEKLQQYT